MSRKNVVLSSGTTLDTGIAGDGGDEHPQRHSVEQLVGRYSSPTSLDDAEDTEITKKMCILLNHSRLDDQQKIRLISGMVAHLADHRPGFVDRACVVATVLFRKDEFDIRNRSCYETFVKFLPINLADNKNFNNKEISIFDQNELIQNDISRITTRRRPLFIQEAVKVLRKKAKTGEMLAVHLRMGEILGRTSDRSFLNHSGDLFELLLDLNVPDLYDHQFKSLALLIARDPTFYDKALGIFFESGLETKRFYIIYTFCHANGLVSDEQKIRMHVKFAERFVEHDGRFDPIVQRQVEVYVGMGLLLLSTVQPGSDP